MFTKLHKLTKLSKNLNLGGNTSIVRFYSNYNWKKFNESSCSIESVLLSGKKSFPDIFQDNTVEFTAIKNSIQKHEELTEMVKAFGRYKGLDGSSIGNLIVFETERRSLQVTGALIPLLVKTPPKNNDFGQFVRDFHGQYIIPCLPESDILIQRDKYFNWVCSIVTNSATREEHPQIHHYFNQAKAELLKRREKEIISLSNSELTELAARRVADALLKQEMDTVLSTIAENTIETLIGKGKFEALPLVSAINANTFIGSPELPSNSYPERFTVLMAGGPGSGKSITTESFALQLQQQTGYALDELALLTVDRKRTIYYDDECVKGTHKKHIGTLTHDEAVVTYNMSGEFLSRRMDQNKKVPNVFKEMCNIWPSWLDIGLKKDGTYLITVSTRKPEKAVDGVIKRGIENNDFVTPPEYVLNSYRSVSERFPQVIQENQSKKVIISVVNNELAIEKKFSKEQNQEVDDNKPAVVVDCESNTIYIVNLLQYMDFINQSQLNSKATSVQELYENADLSIAASMKRVLDPSKFGSSKLAFVRSDIKSTAINELEKNIVAVVQEGELNVLDKEHFDALKLTAPEHFEELEALAQKKSQSFCTIL
ncbi:hypothetical protein [Legionella longbeachae]|uniref:Coiled-coil protein n=1 Tax=Legionella longbeachae serogroup 1 (strain NSW150) TaxID=661367 RepID=D3HSZ6_LEGLN|nr:hypothetical protein [Legionella longbeachae]VEE02527.1 coiled-coil protein [Legionella oakridgensis]HBD7398787.1 hypothetical protein [Legionella pneumophila]ARB91202.1 hypothetical protein A6J40_02920 [Legionella longbeachae]ARM32373.1 hypothetical protein B0B39_01990 [Legionella longbeachae]EEZ94833.1 hypothetical protein LLB_3751 [Legionella longbeachae D-4968]